MKLEYFKKNANMNFMRICRIQISSQLRNANTYPNHYYKIKVKMDNIGNPEKPAYINEWCLDLYAYSNGNQYFANHNEFYIKQNADSDNLYIDIAVPVNSYSTNVRIEIDTLDAGSVTFYCDSATQSEYTRLIFTGSDAPCSLLDGFIYQYLNTGTSYYYNLSKTSFTINDCINNVTAYYAGRLTSSIFNGDNASFTASIETDNDYSIIVKIVPKRNVALYIR